jgi:hypothetical protein
LRRELAYNSRYVRVRGFLWITGTAHLFRNQCELALLQEDEALGGGYDSGSPATARVKPQPLPPGVRRSDGRSRCVRFRSLALISFQAKYEDCEMRESVLRCDWLLSFAHAYVNGKGEGELVSQVLKNATLSIDNRICEMSSLSRNSQTSNKIEGYANNLSILYSFSRPGPLTRCFLN